MASQETTSLSQPLIRQRYSRIYQADHPLWYIACWLYRQKVCWMVGHVMCLSQTLCPTIRHEVLKG
jgi:hypothetical protein